MSARAIGIVTGLVIATTTAVAGCGSHPHRGAGTEIDPPGPGGLVQPRKLGLPEYPRLVVGRLDLPATATVAATGAGGGGAGTQSLAGEETEADPESSGIPIDVEVLRGALRDLVAGSGAFEAVRLAEESPRLGSPEAKGHLVLDTRLEHASLRRTEEDGTARRIATWFFISMAGAWQHDRAYALEVEPVFILRDGETGKALAEVRTATARADDWLSLHERRAGAGAFIGTLFCVPYFLYESTPGRVAAALAPRTLAAPVGELLGRTATFRPVLRVLPPVAHPRAGVRVELLDPKPGARLAGPTAEVAVRVTVRPEAGELAKVLVGPRAVAASGARVEARAKGVPISPGRPLEVKVELAGGEAFVVLEIAVEKALAPPP